MNKILALCGRKQSGKSTVFNLLLGIEMLKLAIVRDKIQITSSGKLWISDIFGDEEYKGIFDTNRKNETMDHFLLEYVHPYIKDYSFADKLKEFCVDVFNIEREMLYGTDEQKNKPTHLKWEDMPGVVNESGYMTARQVMQHFGTNIVRKIYSPAWAKETAKRIQRENVLFAVIPDCRFPDEVNAIKEIGGRVIRLTRTVSEDKHSSETALDRENYDWNQFDAVVDNQNMSIGEQNKAVLTLLREWGWVDPVKDEEEIITR